MSVEGTGIVVDLRFDTPASPAEPPESFARRFDTRIEVDGVTHEFAGGARHFIPCTAGKHTVRIYFVNMKLFGLFRLGLPVGGGESAEIELAEGETVALVYEGHAGWRFGNHELHIERTEP